jgi:hypothetical protein
VKTAAVAIAVALATASPETPSGWLDVVAKAGPAAMLALFIFGLRQEWWFLGREYRDLEERHRRIRDRYDRLVEVALQSSRGVERAATVVEELLKREDS